MATDCIHRALRNLVALALVLAGAACGSSDSNPSSTNSLDPDLVREYLLMHPEIVLDDAEVSDAIHKAHLRRKQGRAAEERRSILKAYTDLLQSPLTPSSYLGVTLTEEHATRLTQWLISQTWRAMQTEGHPLYEKELPPLIKASDEQTSPSSKRVATANPPGPGEIGSKKRKTESSQSAKAKAGAMPKTRQTGQERTCHGQHGGQTRCVKRRAPGQDCIARG